MVGDGRVGLEVERDEAEHGEDAEDEDERRDGDRAGLVPEHEEEYGDGDGEKPGEVDLPRVPQPLRGSAVVDGERHREDDLLEVEGDRIERDDGPSPQRRNEVES